MPKPTLSVFVGDLHVGSHTGVCVPGYMMGGWDKEKKRPYSASLEQKRLAKAFDKMLCKVKELAKGHRIALKLGGDLVDGVNHHGTTETTGNVTDETDMATELLLPWLNAADDVKGVTGTESHVGSKGDWDSIVYTKLGVSYDAKWNIVEDGKRLWWAHHGIRVGGRDWLLENSAVLLAKDVESRCLRMGKPKPDLIVAHHAHRTFPPITIRGITITVCPCWQLSTYYGDSIAPFSDVDLGIVTWKPGTNEVRVINAEGVL
jgi:hypothetical protein